jgi:hypothetical protein
MPVQVAGSCGGVASSGFNLASLIAGACGVGRLLTGRTPAPRAEG